MSKQTIDFYLSSTMIRQTLAGRQAFFSRAKAEFEGLGHEVGLIQDSEAARMESVATGNYNLFYMRQPFHAKALEVRKPYVGQFWKMERTTHREFHHATQQDFDATTVDPARAKRFFDRWTNWVVPDTTPASKNTEYIFIPLQGKLTQARSFQSMSPVEMIETTLKSDSWRTLKITLHPGENYLAAELDAIQELAKGPRVDIVEEDLFSLISGCDYIVTENSSIALKAMFLKKPSIVFAWIDFHHMCQNTMVKPVADCFADVLDQTYLYEEYLFWFLQDQSLNMARKDSFGCIIDRAKKLGWKI